MEIHLTHLVGIDLERVRANDGSDSISVFSAIFVGRRRKQSIAHR